MKKTILTSFLLFVFGFCQAQIQGGCGTKGILRHTENFIRPVNSTPTEPDTTPYVLNAFFTLIKDANGFVIIDGTQIDTPVEIENKFLECIRILNVEFNPYHIYFKYTGYQAINSDIFSADHPFDPESDTNGWNALQQYKQENTMNFYFVNRFVNGLEGAVSAATLGGTESIYLNYALDSAWYNKEFLRRCLIHQVGHNLSLYHTYEAESHLQSTDILYFNSHCERVTRDVEDPLYNADYAGDEVEDTPAQPLLVDNDILSNCIPINPSGTNCWNESYLNNVTKNYMNMQHLSFENTCWAFTSGQVKRMRDYIRDNTENFGYLTTGSVRNDIASLYQPFDIRIVAGAVANTQDQPDNGGALVCRSPIALLRFQPGFAQIFSNTTVGTITVTANDQFNYNNSFDHPIGVKIPSLSNQRHDVGIVSAVEELLCNFEPYVSGTVYSMEVLGQMNITVKELNEIEVRDPELYDTLMAQYYHILKKITASGAETQQTFYKY